MSRAPGAIPEPASRAEIPAFVSDLRGGMGEIQAMVRELLERSAAGGGSAPAPPEMPQELCPYYTSLIQSAVAEEIAREIVAQTQDRLTGSPQGLGDAVRAVLLECIGRMLPAAEPIQLNCDRTTKYVALVGPTGVGKTTTIAKLAAHFKLRQGKRVGLITIDTYRIAALEQLKAYADILNLPLQVVLTPDEMGAALESMSDLDLVLIDTSGRSQRDAPRLEELKAFLDAARDAQAKASRCGNAKGPPRGPDGRFRPRSSPTTAPAPLEVHLVLACTAHPAQLLEAAQKFAAVGASRAVFTKLDEAVGLGVILNVIRRLNLQLSYLTTGQDVPDDIEVGHRRRIAEMILEPTALADSRGGQGAAPSPSMDHVA